MTPDAKTLLNSRVERLKHWRFRQMRNGTYTITKGNEGSLEMNREEAEHIVAQLGLLLAANPPWGQP